MSMTICLAEIWFHLTQRIHLNTCHVHEGDELSESQEGRLRLQLFRLRTDDSGLDLCQMNTDHGFSSFVKLSLRKNELFFIISFLFESKRGLNTQDINGNPRTSSI